jgi:hypothetical protein
MGDEIGNDSWKNPLRGFVGIRNIEAEIFDSTTGDLLC